MREAPVTVSFGAWTDAIEVFQVAEVIGASCLFLNAQLCQDETFCFTH